MAILLADAGSTKTEWALINVPGDEKHFFTAGINPNYLSEQEIRLLFGELQNDFTRNSDVTEIHYYGTGCARPAGADKIRTIAHDTFPSASIHVASDLLAAAIALLQSQAGLAAILGTGAAICHYDGRQITRIAPSAGWMLGDEGSGTHLGKKLLAEYLNGHFSPTLKTAFETECQLDETAVLHKIYQEPAPNRFMASFPYFIEKHLEDDLIRRLCHQAFSTFLQSAKTHFADYQKYTFNIMGSIGFCFQNIIKECAKEQGITIDKIEKTPMPGLIQYHKSK